MPPHKNKHHAPSRISPASSGVSSVSSRRGDLFFRCLFLFGLFLSSLFLSQFFDASSVLYRSGVRGAGNASGASGNVRGDGVGIGISPVSAAGADCQLLTGVTGVVPNLYINPDTGKKFLTNNSGRNFFDLSKGSSDGKTVNLAPDQYRACAQKVGNTVYLKGWFWNDNLGWISLYCPGDGGSNRGIPCGFAGYGVTIDSSGIWSGYAWGNAGWIRMNCKKSSIYTDDELCSQSGFGVRAAATTNRTTAPWIYAWTRTLGWFNFSDITVPSFAVLPDTQNNPGPGGGICIKSSVHACLREGENPYLIEAPVPAPKPADVTLTPGIKGDDDDFPVTWNKVKFLGNERGSVSGIAPVKQYDIRNVLSKSVARWRGVASKSCGFGGNFLTKFTSQDDVYFCKGDIDLKGSLSNWKGNKTIIVEDGDVRIHDSLYSEQGQLGIIVMRSDISRKKWGNVYIGPNVRELRTQIYADGSVLPMNADGDLATQSDYLPTHPDGKPTLFGQLYIRGMIVGNNTGTFSSDESSVKPLPKTFTPTDLAALRSVPADPVSKKPIPWQDYLSALETGTYNQAQTDKDGDYVDKKGEKVLDLFDADKKQKKLPKVLGKTAALKQSLKTLKDSDKFVLNPNDELDQTFGVYFQFEPPARDLGVFEASSSSTYRMTR